MNLIEASQAVPPQHVMDGIAADTEVVLAVTKNNPDGVRSLLTALFTSYYRTGLAAKTDG